MRIAANHGKASPSTAERPNHHRKTIAETLLTRGERFTQPAACSVYVSQLIFGCNCFSRKQRLENWKRPYHVHRTTSRPLSEVKRRRARLNSAFLLHDIADVSLLSRNSLVRMMISRSCCCYCPRSLRRDDSLPSHRDE